MVVWLAMEHGGDFGHDATDPGVGLPYVIVFLYVLSADRLRRDPRAGGNELLALARVAFALLWGYDALLKFQPYFLGHFLDYISEAAKDNAGTWRGAYDQAWIVVIQAIGPKIGAYLVALTEATIAIALFTGRGLRIVGPIAIALSFVIWGTAEEWGGPFSMGVATGMPMRLFSCAIIYILALGYVWVLYNPLDLFRTSGNVGVNRKT